MSLLVVLNILWVMQGTEQSIEIALHSKLTTSYGHLIAYALYAKSIRIVILLSVLAFAQSVIDLGAGIHTVIVNPFSGECEFPGRRAAKDSLLFLCVA